MKLGRSSSQYCNYLEKSKGVYPQGTKRKDCLRHYLRFTNQDWRFLNNAFLVEVTNINTITQASQFVYDLTISNIHHYTAENVRVHNTEVIRRLLIRQFGETQYNESQRTNNMPSWMPGRFRVGDPYAMVPGGEYRLPGKGFEALHPELKGLTPDQYPDAYKLAIIGNVAPYSKERYELERRVQAGYEYGKLSPGELKAFAHFSREQEAIDAEAKKRTYSPPDNLLGRLWDIEGRIGRANPLEHLTPFAPVHKFAPSNDPLEQYKDFQVFDSHYKMWDHPVRDFIAPTINKALNIASMGHYIPSSYNTDNNIEEQFEKIQFIKNQMN